MIVKRFKASRIRDFIKYPMFYRLNKNWRVLLNGGQTKLGLEKTEKFILSSVFGIK